MSYAKRLGLASRVASLATVYCCGCRAFSHGSRNSQGVNRRNESARASRKKLMATIHLVGGEKGGVGKSLVATILAQYFIDHAMPFLGFDADRSHAALLRFYSSYTSPVEIDDYQSLDRIVELAAVESDRRILVDLAAQTHQP